jgi:Lrp/AsnC family leucine-responsive transcriptional regulator
VVSKNTPTAARARLDAIDRRILDVLAADGRASVVEVADAVGLSASPTLRRIRRLEETGVITGYRAVVDPAALGRNLTVFMAVKLTAHDEPSVRSFEEALERIPEIVSAHHVTGDVDYLLRVELEDLAALDRLSRQRLTSIPGLGFVTTYVSTSALKD